MSDQLKDDSLLARWLSGALSAKERQELENHPDFSDWQDIVEGVDQLEPDLPTNSRSYNHLQAKLQGRSAKVRRLPNRRAWLAIAASFLLVLSFFWWQRQGTTQVQTARVEQRSVELKDGSLAYLKAETVLEYSRGSKREILVEGEVLLNVEKGEEPFTVQSPYGSIQVLGTTFNVFAREGVLEVRCFSGRVAVYNPAGQQMGELIANEAIRLVDGELELNYPMETGSWHSEQRSSFQAVPLQRVMDELARTYDLVFIFNGSEINTEQHFVGFFPHNDLDTALGDVFSPMGIVATKGEGKAVRLEPAGE